MSPLLSCAWSCCAERKLTSSTWCSRSDPQLMKATLSVSEIRWFPYHTSSRDHSLHSLSTWKAVLTSREHDNLLPFGKLFLLWEWIALEYLWDLSCLYEKLLPKTRERRPKPYCYMLEFPCVFLYMFYYTASIFHQQHHALCPVMWSRKWSCMFCTSWKTSQCENKSKFRFTPVREKDFFQKDGKS